MSRLNFSKRHGPDEFDDTAPTTPSLEFDYTHQGGAAPWPEKHAGIKFGPALINRAWKAGLVVYAEIEGWPHPIAVQKAQGPRIPRRLFTRPNAKDLTSSGLLIEGG